MSLKVSFFSATLGAIFNVSGYGWTKSLNVDDLPLEGNILRKLITLCDIRIQDVRQYCCSIGFNHFTRHSIQAHVCSPSLGQCSD